MPRLNNRWRKILKNRRIITATMLAEKGAPSNPELVLNRYGFRDLSGQGVLWQRLHGVRSVRIRRSKGLLAWLEDQGLSETLPPWQKELIKVMEKGFRPEVAMRKRGWL